MKGRTKRILLLGAVAAIVLAVCLLWNHEGQIRLIVRGDDMGLSHEVNVACFQAYQEGILTAVEVMVPCDSFMEAVSMLRENPGLDVGIHLPLTSEWENIKWGPMTDAPSLVDEHGYFFPLTWPDDGSAPQRALGTSEWKLGDIEQELRAQIELMRQHLPRCSHATAHMGFHAISPDVGRLAVGLIRDYDVDANLRLLPLSECDLFGDASTTEEMVAHAVELLENLGPGTWECHVHPGLITEGVEAHWQYGAEGDACHRDAVRRALTHIRLKEVITRRGIQLVGYRDLRLWD